MYEWDKDFCYFDYEVGEEHNIPDFKRHDYTYLNLLSNLSMYGRVKEQRAVLKDGTKPKTRSIFGEMLKFDLTEYFPLLTTKKMYWKGIVHELLWFLKGDTNIKYLLDNNVHIWDDNAYDYYLRTNEGPYTLDKETFIKAIKNNSKEIIEDELSWSKYTYGDLGPVYGKQWRDFGGVDQIAKLIKDINEVKENPNCSCSRRLIISSFNPPEIPDMALPPCHVIAQWDVYNGELSCILFQRSCDYLLGAGFNIASYSLLTHLIAKTCDLKPKELVYSLGDVHIYENHLEAVNEQLKSIIHPSPKLEIINRKSNLEDYVIEDIKLIDYKYSELKTKPEMAV